jgi:hypothetical protein
MKDVNFDTLINSIQLNVDNLFSNSAIGVSVGGLFFASAPTSPKNIYSSKVVCYHPNRTTYIVTDKNIDMSTISSNFIHDIIAAM